MSAIFRNFGELGRAKFVAQQRGGVIRRNHQESCWAFYPNSKHAFDTLNDAERERVRSSHTFNDRRVPLEMVSSEYWAVFEYIVRDIISGKTLDDSPDANNRPGETEFDNHKEPIDYVVDEHHFNDWDCERHLIEQEIAEDRECYHRSNEEGWYYPDED